MPTREPLADTDVDRLPLADTELVADFMRPSGQTVRTSPTADITEEERLLRARLVFEEACEFVAAMGCTVLADGRLTLRDSLHVVRVNGGSVDLVEATDALADLIVVTKGSAHTLGVPVDAAVRIVHETNLAKIDPETGTVLRRADGKIIKPEGWQPPTAALIELLDGHRVQHHSPDLASGENVGD